MTDNIQKSRILRDQSRRSQSVSSSSLSRVETRTIIDSSHQESVEKETDEILNFEMKNTFSNKSRFLWIDANRRNKYKSTSAHEHILRVMKTYLLTWLISGQEDIDNWTAWSKTRRMWLSDSMHIIWRQLTCRMRRRKNVANRDVRDKSMSKETRKIRSFFLS
jgi:ABC-type transport system involved in Fe-S cluster assembly fused permease/ATPase subunit